MVNLYLLQEQSTFQGNRSIAINMTDLSIQLLKGQLQRKKFELRKIEK